MESRPRGGLKPARTLFLDRVVAWDGRSWDEGADPAMDVTVAEDRQTPLRTWAICGLMLLATMLNYMNRLNSTLEHLGLSPPQRQAKRRLAILVKA